MQSGYRASQIVLPPGVDRIVGLLSVDRMAGQESIEQARRRRERHELLREQGEEVVELHTDAGAFHSAYTAHDEVSPEEAGEPDTDRR